MHENTSGYMWSYISHDEEPYELRYKGTAIGLISLKLEEDDIKKLVAILNWTGVVLGVPDEPY